MSKQPTQSEALSAQLEDFARSKEMCKRIAKLLRRGFYRGEEAAIVPQACRFLQTLHDGAAQAMAQLDKMLKEIPDEKPSSESTELPKID